MMKKLGLFLVVLLALSAFALSEPVQPTVDELMTYCDQRLLEALEMGQVSPQPAEEGGYCFDLGAFDLYSPDSTLSPATRVTGIVLKQSGEQIADMRGIGPGTSLSVLLSAYPLDNETLTGTYDEAVLSICGMLPEAVNTGFVVRSGAHTHLVGYDIYNADGEQVEKCSIVYTLENNEVASVEILLSAALLPLEEAFTELERLSALQEESGYSVYAAQTPEVLSREDLRFGSVDFLSADPAQLSALLGSAYSDTWEADGDGFLRIMQWDGVQAVFAYDHQKAQSALRLLAVNGDTLEGPRSLCIGDSDQSVFLRFPDEGSGHLLYGDGETAPYGVYEAIGDTAHMTFAVSVEEDTVLLSLTLLDGRLVDITCTYR